MYESAQVDAKGDAFMIKAILIDVDNTLLDFDACVKAALRDGFDHFGLPAYREEMFPVFTEINNALWHRIETGELTREQLMQIRFDRIFEALGIDFDGVTFEDYFRRYLFDSAIYVEGALELLQYLADKYIVCAASNGPYRQQIHRLEISGMAPYLTHSFISEQVGAEKPSRAFFDVCMQVLGGSEMYVQEEPIIAQAEGDARDRAITAMSSGGILPGLLPKEVMMIGDSLTADMSGGIAYGMQTCWYDRSGKGLPEGIVVDHVVRTLAEIRDIL